MVRIVQEAFMNRAGIIFSVLVFFIFAAFQHGEAKRNDYYRTFEIIGISGNSLTLEDRDGNVIEVNKDPGDFKVGYMVRYDSVRGRLRPYRWQDYEVIAVNAGTITLEHKTGDTISVQDNDPDAYGVGDMVRYDSVGDKLQPNEDDGTWQQYTVVAASDKEITLESNDGKQVILAADNNFNRHSGGAYIGKYKVGDLVRYHASTNKLRKGVIRTYDWQEYEVKEVKPEHLILIDKNKEELILENTYDSRFNAGDSVKYDRLNDLLKKVR